ncbi:MAG: hypothetical protein LBK28_01930 [Propionibacteriaceae bacterium]|jgi:hypothetical protein|nr:hypothetical protein [Propionibacteriaceae bacterium]
MKKVLNKRRLWIVAAFAVAAGVLAWLLLGGVVPFFTPSLTLQSPAPLSVGDREEVVIDVVLSRLPDGLYPAASLSVQFDPNKLEFTGIKQGTMMTRGALQDGQPTFHVPLWQADIAVSNQRGQVNTMYLDTTGGTFAYTSEGFATGSRDVLLRLGFRLRDSVQAGEIYRLSVADAVLATIGGSADRSSLATSSSTLIAYPAEIVVK